MIDFGKLKYLSSLFTGIVRHFTPTTHLQMFPVFCSFSFFAVFTGQKWRRSLTDTSMWSAIGAPSYRSYGKPQGFWSACHMDQYDNPGFMLMLSTCVLSNILSDHALLRAVSWNFPFVIFWGYFELYYRTLNFGGSEDLRNKKLFQSGRSKVFLYLAKIIHFCVSYNIYVLIQFYLALFWLKDKSKLKTCSLGTDV